MRKYACIGSGLLTLDHLFFLDHFPQPGEKVHLSGWQEQVGGPVPVGLMTMHQLDKSVAWFGVTGKDAAGQKIFRYWNKINFPIQLVKQNSKEVTAQAFVWIDTNNGERNVFLAGNTSEPNDIEPSDLLKICGKSDWIYLDGRQTGFQLQLKQAAKKAGCRVFLDLGSSRDRMDEFLEGADVVIVSKNFGRQVFPGNKPEAVLRKCRKKGAQITGMTLGRNGSIFFDGQQFYTFPAEPVKSMDTTCAGDIFHGAFLSKYIDTDDLKISAQFASRVAGWSIQHQGHQLESLPAIFRLENNLRLNYFELN